jgi:hypothetical protein
MEHKNGASNDYMADYNMRTKKMKEDISNLIIDHDAELAEMKNDIEIREVQLEYYGVDFPGKKSKNSFKTFNDGDLSFGISDLSDPLPRDSHKIKGLGHKMVPKIEMRPAKTQTNPEKEVKKVEQKVQDPITIIKEIDNTPKRNENLCNNVNKVILAAEIVATLIVYIIFAFYNPD